VTLFDVDESSPPSGPVTRLRMTVAYDGSRFHGFAAQAGIETVGGTLAAAIGRVLRLPAIELTCAGRTDAGVHAWGQVVSFDVPSDLVAGHAEGGRPADALVELQQALNKLCGPAVVVREVCIAPDDFDARFSARWRRYRYTIVNRPFPDPFLAPTAWHVAVPLDVRAMTMGCDPFIGEHDFSSFCRRPKPGRSGPGRATPDGPAAAIPGDGPPPVSLVRRVRSARWEETGDGVLHFWIEANAFCHQMVRSVVGTLVDVGRGRLRAGDLTGVIAARDRHAAGDLAPPHGLCLWEVGYD
jgi:tRNA pseudouridine38-40 synthase